jgi:L-iditol 2-dehydrogenase
MKAVVLTGIRRMEVVDVAKPRIERDTDVLLKIEAVGICGSDIHYYETGRIGSEVIEYPFIIGHECAATVEAVGSGVRSLGSGVRVVVEPAIICEICDQCKAGRKNTCRNLRFLGCPGQMPGCLCEYIVMPESCCLPIDDKITFSQAVLCEPLAIGMYAVRQAKMTEDGRQKTDVAILGAGPIGLSCLLASKAEGVRNCFVTEKVEGRIEAAKKAGARWVGNPEKEDIVAAILKQKPEGLDVVFECAGQQETIDQAVELLKPGGKLMLIGIPRSERISLVIERIRRKEISIINVRRQNECTQTCIDWISSGKIKPDFMITHRFKLEQTPEAFDMVSGYRDGVIKAIIEP